MTFILQRAFFFLHYEQQSTLANGNGKVKADMDRRYSRPWSTSWSFLLGTGQLLVGGDPPPPPPPPPLLPHSFSSSIA